MVPTFRSLVALGLCHNGLLTRYAKLRVAHAPGIPGTFSPSLRVCDPDMHHGTWVTHLPRCMPGSLNSRFLWSRWQGKCSRHSWHMHNPLFYVSGKRPMTILEPQWWRRWHHENSWGLNGRRSVKTFVSKGRMYQSFLCNTIVTLNIKFIHDEYRFILLDSCCADVDRDWDDRAVYDGEHALPTDVTMTCGAFSGFPTNFGSLSHQLSPSSLEPSLTCTAQLTGIGGSSFLSRKCASSSVFIFILCLHYTQVSQIKALHPKLRFHDLKMLASFEFGGLHRPSTHSHPACCQDGDGDSENDNWYVHLTAI